MKQALRSLILGLTLTAGLSTAGTTSNTTIRQLLLYDIGDLVFVYPAIGVTAPLACAGANGYYTFRMDRPRAREYLAGLMAAQVAGLNVNLIGTGACTDDATSETLAYFVMEK